MPRKEKRRAEESKRSSKRAHEEPPADTKQGGGADWRNTLYFMHGEVSTNETGDVTIWEGTWVASEGGLPSLQAFEESGDSFRLTSSDFLGAGVPLEIRCPFGRSGEFKGTYVPETGSKFYDYEHNLVVMDHSPTCSLVAERGSSTIGNYVSVGRLTFREGKNPPVATLTLARRYIDAEDPRGKTTAWQNMMRLAGQVSRPGTCREKNDFEKGATAPWMIRG